MFRLIQNGSVRGDCTCAYRVELDRKYTVGEFIETVLTERSGEWGYIGIRVTEGGFSERVFGNPCCEYKWGKLLSTLPKKYLKKKITEVTGDGGWSRMDYLITLEVTKRA